jgi:hypothetical protein
MKFENYGYCYCCDQNTKFVALNEWFRDHYTCRVCASIPRERFLIYSVENFSQIAVNVSFMNPQNVKGEPQQPCKGVG